jgi:hypothetical protein
VAITRGVNNPTDFGSNPTIAIKDFEGKAIFVLVTFFICNGIKNLVSI